MNYAKICGNMLVGFCTAAIPVVVIGAAPEALVIGLGSAALTGILAAGLELQAEGDSPPSAAAATMAKNTLLVV